MSENSSPKEEKEEEITLKVIVRKDAAMHALRDKENGEFISDDGPPQLQMLVVDAKTGKRVCSVTNVEISFKYGTPSAVIYLSNIPIEVHIDKVEDIISIDMSASMVSGAPGHYSRSVQQSPRDPNALKLLKEQFKTAITKSRPT